VTPEIKSDDSNDKSSEPDVQAPNVRRCKVDVNTDTIDKDKIRVYYSPELGLGPVPSVSVIKGLREDPDKEAGLQGWRDRFDGQSSWGRPWWNDQREFKALRGTLVHFAILNALGDAAGETYYHEVGDSDWGLEEYYAAYCLNKWSKKAPSANTNDVPYTPRDNKYDGEHAWDKAMRGVKWATRTFKTGVIDGNKPDGVTVPRDTELDGRFDRDNVIEVEQFVYDNDYGYAGQYDLLYYYVDDDGNRRNVLSDVKTSSAVRFDHKLQSAAYKRAVESSEYGPDEIHETEIIRLHPDKEVLELSRSPEWDRTLGGLAHEFLGLTDKAVNAVFAETLHSAHVELMETETPSEPTEEGTVNTDNPQVELQQIT